jgi:hypothetical protein
MLSSIFCNLRFLVIFFEIACFEDKKTFVFSFHYRFLMFHIKSAETRQRKRQRLSDSKESDTEDEFVQKNHSNSEKNSEEC